MNKDVTRAFYPSGEPGIPTISITLHRTYTRCLSCNELFQTEIRRMSPGEFEFRSQNRCQSCR